MIEAVGKILAEECGLVKDKPIIVGVSGGPDSLCLMEVLRQAGYKIIVAYFDHQLRPDSNSDGRKKQLEVLCVGGIHRGDCGLIRFSGSYAVNGLNRQYEHFAIADLAGHCGTQNRLNRALHERLGHADLEPDLLLQFHFHGRATIGLHGLDLAAVTLHA